MGRGNAWDIAKNNILVRAWISGREDTIAGAHQKGKVIFDTMCRRIIEKGPACGAVDEGNSFPIIDVS